MDTNISIHLVCMKAFLSHNACSIVAVEYRK